MNQKYLASLARKCFELNFTHQIHQVDPESILSLSSTFVKNAGLLDHYVDFIHRNTLYMNPYVTGFLKRILDQNYHFERIPEYVQEELNIMNFTIRDVPMKDSQ